MDPVATSAYGVISPRTAGGGRTSAWLSNAIALLLLSFMTWLLALALLWRISALRIGRADRLIEHEGLPIGYEAPEVAAHQGGREVHLSIVGGTTFLAFGLRDCRPCDELLSIVPRHPATRYMRLVYLSDDERVDVEPQVAAAWEVYRLHNPAARAQWHAPVSPYFHVINEHGRVIAKGVANKPEHLDRLLSLFPDGSPTGTAAITSTRSEERQGV